MVEAALATLVVANVAPIAAPARMATTAPAEGEVAASDMVPPAEPEATAETLVHPHDVDLGIPPQEVSSAYVRIPTLLYLSYVFFVRILN